MNTDLDMEALDKVVDKIFQRKTMKAVEDGEVVLGDMAAICAVLNDEQETTVFSLRTFESIVGIRPKGWKTVAQFLPPFMRESDEEKYRNKYLSLSNFSLIPFTLKRGGKALGITVEQTNEVMQGWIDAYNDGALTGPQIKVAQRMQAMKNAASVSGFTQVIHERLGYVDIRKRTMAELFHEIFEKEYHSWAHQFDMEYYEHIYRLKGKMNEWKKLLATVGPGVKPQTEGWVGRITNNIVYGRLKPPWILKFLQKKNPVIPGTRSRARRHHQYLTKDEGLKKLNIHLGRVIMLMQLHKDEKWDDFYEQLNLLHPLQNGQMHLDFIGPKLPESASDEVHPKLPLK